MPNQLGGGFATASDKHRIEALVRRGVHLQLYGASTERIALSSQEDRATATGNISDLNVELG